MELTLKQANATYDTWTQFKWFLAAKGGPARVLDSKVLKNSMSKVKVQNSKSFVNAKGKFVAAATEKKEKHITNIKHQTQHY